MKKGLPLPEQSSSWSADDFTPCDALFKNCVVKEIERDILCISSRDLSVAVDVCFFHLILIQIGLLSDQDIGIGQQYILRIADGNRAVSVIGR